MDDFEAGMPIILLIGLIIFIIGLLYSKKIHHKFGSSDFLYYSNDSLLWAPVFFVLELFFGFGPWWLMKTLYLVIGLIMVTASLSVLLE
ncbi:hypothetical protein NM897_17090 (plasmid) [Planococcus maritimus]|uniref:hypothetical protein n=1 Tax=Planococcus maritimus TaxID=192421 RepID=UPI003139A6F0